MKVVLFVLLLLTFLNLIAQQNPFATPAFHRALDSICYYSNNNFESLFAEDAHSSGSYDSTQKWPAKPLLPNAAIAYITKESEDDIAATYLYPISNISEAKQLHHQLLQAVQQCFDLRFYPVPLNKDLWMPSGRAICYSNKQNSKAFINRAFSIRSYLVADKNYIGISFNSRIGSIREVGFYQTDIAIEKKLQTIYNGMGDCFKKLNLTFDDEQLYTRFTLFGIRGYVECDSLATDASFYYSADCFQKNTDAVALYKQLASSLQNVLNGKVNFTQTIEEDGSKKLTGQEKHNDEAITEKNITIKLSKDEETGKMSVSLYCNCWVL